MRTLASLFAGLIIAGLLIIGAGVHSYEGPYFDPKCSGEYCDIPPGVNPEGRSPIHPLPVQATP